MAIERALLLVFLIVCIGCASEEPGGVGRGPDFFNSEEFFTQEADRLNANETDLEKQAELNGEQELRQFAAADVDWERELADFRGSNIDKPGLWEHYAIDSIRDSNGLQGVEYRATKLAKVDRLRVLFAEDGNPAEITMELSTQNFLLESKRSLRYTPSSGFAITGTQKVPFLKSNRFNLEGRFLP